MHPSKEKVNLSRAEAVQRLKLLAREVEEGAVYLEERAYPVPDQVNFEIQANGHEIEVELKWKSHGAHQKK
jgi:amphi-Trp domain-containing protein